MDVYGWDKKHRHESALLGEMLHIEAAGQPNTTVCGKQDVRMARPGEIVTYEETRCPVCWCERPRSQAHASPADTKRPYTGSDAWLA